MLPPGLKYPLPVPFTIPLRTGRRPRCSPRCNRAQIGKNRQDLDDQRPGKVHAERRVACVRQDCRARKIVRGTNVTSEMSGDDAR
jgi:hypothetical protein